GGTGLKIPSSSHHPAHAEPGGRAVRILDLNEQGAAGIQIPPGIDQQALPSPGDGPAPDSGPMGMPKDHDLGMGTVGGGKLLRPAVRGEPS
ncbi:hypothetical protein, partial [Klebsiella pneumoniae]|uniref:hypothetical protein n=1 Tax=Klebsiella pneumoniae TaxID=573 RepID=UPI001D0F37CB